MCANISTHRCTHISVNVCVSMHVYNTTYSVKKREREGGGNEKLGFLIFMVTIKSKNLLATSLSCLAHKLFVEMHTDNIIILVPSH